jgi:hypothetical protein
MNRPAGAINRDCPECARNFCQESEHCASWELQTPQSSIWLILCKHLNAKGYWLHTCDSLGQWFWPACSFRSTEAVTLLEFFMGFSLVFRFYYTDGASGRYYTTSKTIFFSHLFVLVLMPLILLATFLAQISVSFCILVPHMCVIYYSFYCIFSCYLPTD